MHKSNVKKAFTLIEIIVIIFIVSLVVSVAVPLIAEDSLQGVFISRWTKIEKDTKYFFSVFKIFHEDYVRDFNGDDKISSDEIFHYYLKYVGEGTFHDIDTKKYKYRYLNNKIVHPMSSDAIHYIVETNADTLIGYSTVKDNCDDILPCGRLYFDVNGIKPPNKFGKDIFGFNVFKSKIEVFGYGKGYPSIEKDCSPAGSGLYCSSYYSDGGRLN